MLAAVKLITLMAQLTIEHVVDLLVRHKYPNLYI